MPRNQLGDDNFTESRWLKPMTEALTLNYLVLLFAGNSRFVPAGSMAGMTSFEKSPSVSRCVRLPIATYWKACEWPESLAAVRRDSAS
jgi:hypothetical protein